MVVSSSNTEEIANVFWRKEEDEQEDMEKAVECIMSGAFKEWPNEAGFDGLTEEQGPVELEVKGTIPSYAAGVLYRTGPGQCKIDDTVKGTYHISHWFDGLAHTHRFDISADSTGKVSVFYSSRRQSDALAQRIRENGDRDMYSFGQKADPCIGLLSKFQSVFQGVLPSASAKKQTTERRRFENVAVTVNFNMPGLPSAAARGCDFAKSLDTGVESPAETPVQAIPDSAPNEDKIPAEFCHIPKAADIKSIWLGTDTASLREVDANTLEPIGWATQERLHPSLTGPLSCAHAQRDPKTGDVFNFNLAMGPPASTYRVFRVSASTGKTEILATISQRDVPPAYIHSFYLTQNHVILCVQSSHLSLAGVRVLWEHNLLDSITAFDPNNPKLNWKWFVIDRTHGQGVVGTFQSPPAFFFHSVNAFEERGPDDTCAIYCDVVQYPSTDVLSSLYYNIILNRDGAAEAYYADAGRAHRTLARLTRYKLALSGTKQAARRQQPSRAERLFEIPGPHAGELPTINPAFATRRHRFVYGIANRGRSTVADTLAKTDTEARAALLWDGPAGHSPGEAIFVPRPAAAAAADEDEDEDEDDGVLLSVVLDGFGRRSYLLCLDARNMVELGRAEVPFAVGMGFHGAYAKV